VYGKIIIGYDGSENGEDALALAQTIGKASDAELVVVGVFPEGPFVDPEQQDEFARRTEVGPPPT
jgi:nucleotide-binding universal stress UspA family protein